MDDGRIPKDLLYSELTNGAKLEVVPPFATKTHASVT